MGVGGAAGHGRGAGQPKPFPVLTGTSIPELGVMCPPAMGTRLCAYAPCQGVLSSQPHHVELAAGRHPATAGGHRLASPKWPQTLPSPVGQPGSRSTAGSPQLCQCSESLRSWEHTCPTPPATATRGSHGRQSRADVAGTESVPAKGRGRSGDQAGTHSRQQRWCPEAVSPPPPSSHAAPRSRGGPHRPTAPPALTAPHVLRGGWGARPGGWGAAPVLLLHGGAANPGTRAC